MDSDSHETGRDDAAATLNARLKSIGVKEAYASHLATGKRRPSLELALEIEAKLGIPPSFWRDRPDLTPALERAAS